MTEAIHPYIRYAQALIMLENDLSDCENIEDSHIADEIEKGLNVFRVQPKESFEGKESIKYDFVRKEKGDTKKGVFLSSSTLSTDKEARYIWKAANELIVELRKYPRKKNKKVDLTTSVAPTVGEYLNFSLTGNIGRGKPKATLMEQGLCAVSTLTQYKPCLWVRKGKKSPCNVAIIPDLSVDRMKDFIALFKRLRMTRISESMTGRVSNKKGVYQPERPLLFRGNFPNAPKSSAFGSVGILGAIGEMVKEESVSKMAKRVLHSLKDTRIYLIQYGGAAVFTYNHHVIDLASKGKLMSIVGDLYHSRLYQGERKEKPEEYQKFDLFASRFLQLFNRVSFKDFLAIRAEYPSSLDVLFKTYFLKMEGFEKKREVVSSAMSLGRWLNEVAYYAAKMKVEPPDDGEKIWTTKSKFLVELESSTFSAKSGHALLAQTVTRAGRLSGWDAPEEAGLFMKEVAVGSLNLEEAKNLLVAFSRLKYERKSENIEDSPEEDEETNTDDISDV